MFCLGCLGNREREKLPELATVLFVPLLSVRKREEEFVLSLRAADHIHVRKNPCTALWRNQPRTESRMGAGGLCEARSRSKVKTEAKGKRRPRRNCAELPSPVPMIALL